MVFMNELFCDLLKILTSTNYSKYFYHNYHLQLNKIYFYHNYHLQLNKIYFYHNYHLQLNKIYFYHNYHLQLNKIYFIIIKVT